MRFFARWTTAGAVLAVAACSVPTDKSQDIQVLVRVSDTLVAHGVLGRGERDSVFAFAFRLGTAGDTLPLPNAGFAWSSSDPNIALVEGIGSAAEVTGVNIGVATISARPVAFEDANSGQAAIRVAPPFVIDSVRPTFVRYGEKVRLYGVGIRNVFFVSLGGADLIRDFFSFTGNDAGLGSEEYWVPFSAFTDQPFYVGPGFFGNAQDLITVDPRDIFEPDTSPPAAIDINGLGGPRPFIGQPTLFFNPAMFFEPVTSGSSDVDWARFDRNDDSAVTIFVNSEVFGDTAFPFISDSLLKCGPGTTAFDYCFQPPDGWFYTPGRQFCGSGRAFSYPSQPRLPSIVVAFRKFPTSRLHLLQFYAREGRYELIAVRGYLPVDRQIPPDRFEDNTLCWQADTNFLDSVGPARRQIEVGLAPPFGVGLFRDSLLSISDPLDVDFYRFRVNASGFAFDTLVTIQTKSRPLSGVDPSDVDLYLFGTNGSFFGSSTNIGSAEQVTATLGAGEYYVVVVDVAGQPAVYSMCIVKSTGCTPPGSARPARVTAKPHARLPLDAVRAASGPASVGNTLADPRSLSPRR